MNMELAKRIKLIENPVWSESGKKLFYTSNGPGSFVSDRPFDGYTHETVTLSIDDYLEKNIIDRVDFIKMDIEGAELNSLKGSVKTLKKFKPKLSIALYHNTMDFDTIPRFINDLNLGYKFYLSHSTIYDEETMLFASCFK